VSDLSGPMARAKDRVSIRVLLRKPKPPVKQSCLARPNLRVSKTRSTEFRVCVGLLGLRLRSHAMIRLGGATSRTAPRIATNFRPVLRHDLKLRSLTTTFAPCAYTTSTRSYIPVFEKTTVFVKKEEPGKKAPYTTMASATSFFDFKPKDSTSHLSFLSLSPISLRNSN